MDDRVLRRSATAWPAECVIGRRVVVGTVRDVTSKGAFFQPRSPGQLDTHRESGSVAERDQAVTLRMLYRMTPDVEVAGKVRWSGVSDTHGCGGLGLEFTGRPVMLRNHAVA